MNFENIAKILIIVGIGIAVLGGIVFLLARFPFFGNLPGDINIRRENFSLQVPCATSIILSIILTIIINVIIRLLIRR
ncbi:MAG: DUF2905 domain-containing protein [Actinomycetota bacterium]